MSHRGSKTIMYPEPKTVWLKHSNSYVHQFDLTGETPVSWLTGPTWRLRRWAKKDYQLVDETEAFISRWAESNRYKIAEQIRYHADHEQLARIASILNYEPPCLTP